MRLLPLAYSLAVMALTDPALSQVSASANEVVELATVAPIDGQADHATIAVNDAGDVMIVWSSSVYPRGHALSKKRRVEAAFFRRTSLTTWDLYPTHTLGEAETSLMPGGVPIYPTGDRCRKPDVVAIGTDFVASWQRFEESFTANGRIEGVYLEIPIAGGDMMPHLADPAGIGHVLDPNVDCRTAGAMVDLGHNPGAGPTVIATYCSRTAAYPLGMSNAFDFDLRAVMFEFASAAAAPTVHPVQTVRADVHFDDFSDTSTFDGGRVLPDVVFDQFGNVVIAHEDFTRGDRVGTGTPDEGLIYVQRLSVDSAGVMTPLNSQTIFGTSTEHGQRRPNLFRAAANSDICMAFGERNIATWESTIFLHSVVYPDGASDAVISDHAITLIPTIDEEEPTSFQFKNARGTVIAVDPPLGHRRIGYQLVGTGTWNVLTEFNAFQPSRPAIDVLDVDPMQTNHGVVAISAEGRPVAGAELRVFAEIILP
ncbi:MAG: hypothetical protein H8E15_09970 [Planctomycetes bacterium]|nr:hypothetical protein [Planctomycetota bacterium]